MNSIQLDGRLGKDPQAFGNGKVVSCSIANNVLTRNPTTGVTDSKTNWIELKAFGKNAEKMMTLRKGDLILVYGALRQETWESLGRQHSKLTVTVNQFFKLVPLAKLQQQQQEQEELPPEGGEYPWANEQPSGDDDVPF